MIIYMSVVGTATKTRRMFTCLHYTFITTTVSICLGLYYNIIAGKKKFRQLERGESCCQLANLISFIGTGGNRENGLCKGSAARFFFRSGLSFVCVYSAIYLGSTSFFDSTLLCVWYRYFIHFYSTLCVWYRYVINFYITFKVI